MNCNEVSALLEALHDGALNSEIEADMMEHVSACSACYAGLVRIQSLSGLLQKSLIPAPTPELDVRLMDAFSGRYGRQGQKRSWWHRAFVGSVSIPKPAFAAALVAVAVALAAVAMIGRGTEVPSGGVAAVQEYRVAAPAPAQPAIVERTKIVEVPVVRERVVTRTLFVERKRTRAGKVQEPALAGKPSERELAMSDSISSNGYITLADLSNFQPAMETKARVLREVRPDEK